MTLPNDPGADKCGICNQTRRWHEDHKPKHKFVEPDSEQRIQRAEPEPTPEEKARSLARDEAEERMRKSLQEPGRIMPLGPPPTITFPTDPALRLLLVEKGLITVDEIATQDAKLQAISGGGIVFSRPPEPS